MRRKRGRQLGRAAKLVLVSLLTIVTCLAAVTLAVNAFPRLLVTLLGLEHIDTSADELPPKPTSLTLNGERLDHVDITIASQVAEPLTVHSVEAGSGDLQVASLLGDASGSGMTTYLLSIDEESLNELVWERVFPRGLEDNRYRNGAIDLQPEGLILYADVDLGIRWHRMGLLFMKDKERLTLSPTGVMVGGELYAMPESGSLARLLLPARQPAQQALRALRIVGPLPGEARVEIARFHHDYLQILARATYTVPTPPDTGWQPLEPGAQLRKIDVTADADGPAERLSIVRLKPAELDIRVHYDPSNPKTISAWGAALDALVVVNGSYFVPESEEGLETLGLLVSDGHRWGTPLRDYAGMLAVTSGGETSVRWLRHRPYDPGEPLTQAMQSFPVLVKPGGVMGFPADADDGTPARRSVVAQDSKGNILLIVAPRGMLSLHEVAIFLTESDLDIDVALNLDGGSSTGMWLTDADAQVQIDSVSPVPSVIAVEMR